MKLNKIASIFLIVISIFSCKENNPKLQEESDNKNKIVETKKFATEYDSCGKTKYLFDAIPHFEKIEDYTFESVGCNGTSIVARYNHPTEQNYEFQTIIYQELNENKPMYNITTAGYEMTSVSKVNGSDISSLKIFDNEVINIKKSPEYYDVSYMATYKKNYTIVITVRGKDLSTTEKVDSFLKKYLEAFKKEELK